MISSGIFFIIGYLLVNTCFIHQLRYTYHTKDYSIFSWLDALVTAFAIDGVTSLIQKLYHFALATLQFQVNSIEIFGSQPIMIFVVLSALFIGILCIESIICKIRYTNVPLSRILKYLLFAKIVVLIASFTILYTSSIIS
jgi:hypothetical protein